MKYSFVMAASIMASMVLGSCNSEPNLGIFTASGDIGNVGQKGSLEFNPSDSSYTLSGSGTNMWFDSDQFHYL